MQRCIVVVLLLLAGCLADDDRDIVGPCVHVYKDPVLHIQTVTNSRTGQAIAALQIRSVSIDGRKQDMNFLKQMSYGVVVYDSVLYCNTPCGFGTEKGEYRIAVSAAGYRDTAIVRSADYAESQGGCPSSSSGGTKISFQLQPTQ